MCVKCCRMVDSVPRWWLSLSWPIQSEHLAIADRMIPPSGREHSHGKTQYIPGMQVLVRSWLWKIYLENTEKLSVNKMSKPSWSYGLSQCLLFYLFHLSSMYTKLCVNLHEDFQLSSTWLWITMCFSQPILH